MIENYKSQTETIISLLRSKIALFGEKTLFCNYHLDIIKPGINNFSKYSEYLDTSSIEGINKINKGQQISYNHRPSRANMQPRENSVWFAKMKDSNKILLLTEQDLDILKNNILSTGYTGINSSNDLPLSVLFSIIVSNDFYIQRNMNSTGTTMAGINNESLLKMCVPKLSLAEANKYETENRFYIDALSVLRRKIKEYKKIKDLLLKKFF